MRLKFTSSKIKLIYSVLVMGFLFLVLNLVTLPRKSFAASLPGDQPPAFSTFCLNPKSSPSDSLHTFDLTANGAPVNQDIYLYACLDSPDGTNCSGGKDAAGHDINAVLAQMGFYIQSPNLIFNVDRNEPFQTSNGDVSATIHIDVRGGTAGMGLRGRFFGVVQSTPVTQPTTGGYGGTASSLQYGTFGFSPPSALTNDSTCTSIQWDPYGRIFDSSSLEPLPQTTTELLDKSKNHYSQIGILNPQSTVADGMFSFYVYNGTYYIDPSKTNYRFPVQMSEIQGQYSLGYLDLYINEDPIIEENKAVHIDIPLVPLGTPYHGPVQLMVYTYMDFPSRNQVLIEGRASHPLTLVRILQGTNELAKMNSDKYGVFRFTLSANQIDPSAKINVILQKYDLTTGLTDAANVQAKSVSPILPYIEGYAYDKNNQVIPNATVRVKLNMSGGTIYQTQADQDGLFKITTRYLPLFPYYLEYVNPLSGQIRKVDTDQIVGENNAYLAKNNVSLMTATVNGQPIDNTFPIISKADKTNSNSNLNQNITPPTDNSILTYGYKQLLTIVLILFILVAATIVGIYIYLRGKNTPPKIM